MTLTGLLKAFLKISCSVLLRWCSFCSPQVLRSRQRRHHFLLFLITIPEEQSQTLTNSTNNNRSEETRNELVPEGWISQIRHRD
jgi:hypothetical protein